MAGEASDPFLRLSRHAGLAKPRSGDPPSIFEVTGSPRSADLDEPIADAIAALGEVNVLLNGAVPSRTVGTAANSVPRSLAYAVSEIVRMLRQDAQASIAAGAIEIAWNAILAGDVDDLSEQIRLEQQAKRA